jgi:hypothetical protein
MANLTTLTKYIGSTRLYAFSWANVAEILAGDTLSSITSVSASPTAGLTLTAGSIVQSFGGSTVGPFTTFSVSGGTAYNCPLITLVATTAGGATLVAEGLLGLEP